MTEEKIKAMGELNISRDTLARANSQFLNLWNEGVCRLREDDVADITKVLREIKGLIKQIDGMKELFSGIMNNKISE